MKRVVLLVDEDMRGQAGYMGADAFTRMIGVTVESVEDVPEPLVQEFLVRVESPWPVQPVDVAKISGALKDGLLKSRSVTVTEVTK